MLGLAEEVHRHPVGWRTAVGNDQDFARPGDHVDADLPEDAAFGAGDIGVAGAGDLVDTRDRGGAVGQCRHGLRAADGEDAVHAGHMGRCQHQKVLLAIRRRHDHHDLAHTRHLRRNGVHQHTRRIRRLATRHIDAHTVQWRDLLAQQVAVFVAPAPAAPAGVQLAQVVLAHTLGRRLQSLALRGRDGIKGRTAFVSADLQRGHAVGLDVVEALRVLQHRCVTTNLHIGKDLGHARFDRRIGLGRPVAQPREFGLEVRRVGVQCADQRTHVCASATAASNASISARIGSRLSLSAA